MASETIIWTVLPNGRKGNQLGFSLFLSPRLSPNGTLADFGLGNWAEKMQSLRVSVELEGGPAVEAALDLSLVNPAAWAGLFPDTTPVRGWALPAHASRELKSFPAASLHNFLKGLYGTVASTPASALSFPSLEKGPVADLVNTVGRMDEIVCQVIGQPAGSALAASLPQKPPLLCLPRDERAVLRLLGPGPARDFFMARQFYTRRPADKVAYLHQPTPAGSPPPEVPDVDFHQAIAMLGDWPRVLRMLGLVIDGAVDVSNLSPAAAGRVRVRETAWRKGTSTTEQHPWTRYQLDGADFRPAPKADSDLAARMLRLGKKGAFDVMQVDVDGAALNVLQFATNQRRYQTEVLRSNLPAMQEENRSVHVPPGASFASSAPKQASLPALRGGGITIARVNRSERLKASLINATANAVTGGDVSFFADDVLRGFRIDVLTNGKWFSLCRRRAKVELPGVGTLGIEGGEGAPAFDEGYVKGSGGATAAGDGPSDPLYVHEALFGWSGWSLVAPRPGRVIMPMADPMNPAAKKDVPVMPTPNAIPADRPDVRLKVPFDMKSEVQAQPGTLPRLRYGRPYRVRARAVDLAGNSLPLETELLAPADAVSDEIVYQRYEPVASPVVNTRTTLTMGEHLETLVIRSKANAAASEADLPSALFNPLSERHILPPRISEMTYETHGLLDGFPSAAAAYAVARLDSGSLQDRAGDARIMNPNGSVFADGTNPADDGKWPGPGVPLAAGQYVAHVGDEITIPWLPDPMSVGAAFIGVAGAPFYRPAPFPGAPPEPGTPPDVRSLRLVLSSGGAAFGPASGQLVPVTLPPGTILKVQMSSLVNPARLKELAVWNLMTEAARTALESYATAGLLWMLSPQRELQLIHAVERPVSPPELATTPIAEESKPIGQTFSHLQGTVTTHSGSTAEVELNAAWVEVEDRIDAPAGASREDRTGHVGFLKIPYGEDARLFPKPGEQPPKHEFGDTKHRWVKYSLVGTTRYLENFPASVTNRRDLITLGGPPTGLIDILSTRRPEPPKVVYIVPTFKWEPSADGTSRKRVGRGLRIYLDRPWYSSGDDEKLGIVLGQPRGLGTVGGVFGFGIPAAVRPYISEWGSDPVSSGPLPNVDRELGPGDFTPDPAAGFVSATSLTLDELNDSATLTVQAVGYDVTFSEERQLWFVDLELNPGRAYFPYVRLALARLQEHAVANAKLSKVVRTEFAQLVADRTATVNRIVVNGLELIDVAVAGVSASTDLGERLTAQTQALLVEAPQKAPQKAPPRGNRPNIDLPIDLPIEIPPIQLPPGVIRPIRNPAAGAGHVVRVHIERRARGMTGDLGWERATADTILASHTFGLSPEVLWKGLLRRPLPAANDANEHRLVIRELELYDTDAGLGGPPIPSAVALPPVGERLVYLDVFPLA